MAGQIGFREGAAIAASFAQRHFLQDNIRRDALSLDGDALTGYSTVPS